jgi:allophanate hydrolase
MSLALTIPTHRGVETPRKTSKYFSVPRCLCVSESHADRSDLRNGEWTLMLTIAGLRRDYLSGEKAPADVIASIFARIRAEGLSPVWISLVDEHDALRRARDVDLSLPLGGVPFAVKDNIDVHGMATTAACPSFAYPACHSATVVTRLLEAGAVLIGKTNMDQFATGLVGTRSPHGSCSSVFDSRFISGGSSSGSAVAVAKELCAFSLGTDTAGSGRVPAAFNNLVGLKPTRGVLSAAGVLPACKSLDCVSIFAANAADAGLVWRVAQGFDARDPYSRAFAPGAGAAPWLTSTFRFGIPRDSDLRFFDDPETPVLYRKAAQRLEEIGGAPVSIDFAPFRKAAELLYSGPWVAERFAAVGEFLMRAPESAHTVVGDIIRSGQQYSAVDAYRAAYRLEELKREAAEEWRRMDVLVVPTAGTIYTKEAVEADPVGLNSNLGYYTNFVNLMDLAAIAIPAGFRSDGLPFGVSLVGPAFTDPALLALAERFLHEASTAPGITPGCISVAVVGAHLSGQPLNSQLTDRGARLVKSCRSSRDYRLFALPDTVPPKPGLVREPGFAGPGIEMEVWSVPEDRFGGFVAAVPPPLAIGNVRLDTSEWVKGFVCEPLALKGASEVTQFGGWKNYLASLDASSRK